ESMHRLFCVRGRGAPISTRFPYTTLFRSASRHADCIIVAVRHGWFSAVRESPVFNGGGTYVANRSSCQRLGFGTGCVRPPPRDAGPAGCNELAAHVQ